MNAKFDKKYFFFWFTFLFCWTVQSQDYCIKYLNVDTATINQTLVVEDGRFGTTAWNDIESTQSVHNRIVFEVVEDSTLVATTSARTYDAMIEVKLWDANSNPSGSPSSTQMATLTFNYDPDARQITANKAFWETEGAHKMEIIVRNVLALPAQAGQLPPLRITGEIAIQRKYNFSCTEELTFKPLPSVTIPQSDTFTVMWNAVDGAETYDLEWAFYDFKSTVGKSVTNGGGSLMDDFDFLFQNNASRVTVKENAYQLNLLYPEGYIFFRVRGARINAEGWREFTQWNTKVNPGITLANFPQKIRVDWHENNTLNWQANTVFAEEGKNIPSVSYYDGSLRSRQQVTRSNATNKAIVGQTLYDYHGRPVVNILPSPVPKATIEFDPLFAAKSANTPFTKSDFDLGDCSSTTPTILDDNYGASRYYSSNNNYSSIDIHQYVPDAEGVPYSITEYTPDLTGRVRRQGGVGSEFQLDKRPTLYLYGKPTQEEIDRLFGNDVGHRSHYLKNAVIDPNGQASVSYVDAHGRTIATALSGDKPSNVTQIDSGFQTVGSYTTDLLDTAFQNANRGEMSLMSTDKLIITAPGNQTFTYSVDSNQFRKDCLSANICYDCVYDLTIQLTDNNCNTFNNNAPYIIRKANFRFSDGLDTLCNGMLSGGSIDTSFTIYLPQGEYTITKTLTVSEESLDFYTEHFLSQSTCIPPLEDIIDDFISRIDPADCGLTCEECVTSLGDRETFASNLVSHLAESGQNMSMAAAREIFDERKKSCEALCREPTRCEVIYNLLLTDISPGGQYALYELDEDADTLVATDPTSVFFNHAYQSITYLLEDGMTEDTVTNAAGQLVTPSQLNLKEFIALWKIQWAESLVQLHPEYCIYTEWCVNNGLDSMDYCQALEATESWQEAVDSSYADSTGIINDPFFEMGAAGYDCISFRDSLLDSLVAGIGLVEHITTFVYGDSDCNTGLGSGTRTENDLAWQLYKHLYCNALMPSIMQEKIDQISCSNLLTCIENPLNLNCNGTGSNYYKDKKKRFRFPDAETYTQSEAEQLADSVGNEIVISCDSNCINNVELWITQLYHCDLDNNLPADSLQRLKDRLIAVCRTACDSQHPFGSSTTPSGIVSSFGDTSFEDILNDMLVGVISDCSLDCSPLSITSMRPYTTPEYRGPEIRSTVSNTCICDNLEDLKSCYDALPNGSYASFSQYLSQFSESRLTDAQLDTLQLYCTSGSSTTLPEYMYIPPYLECDVCKDCSDLAVLKMDFERDFCTSDSSGYDQLLARYLNNELGFALDWYEYKVFFERCDSINICSASKKLCPLLGELADSVGSCYRNFIVQATYDAKMVHEALLDSIRTDFRRGYIEECLNNSREIFNANLLDQEYHYTLYYYDQAGNLVQTVPPNGVKPITDPSTLLAVKRHRYLDTSPAYPSHSYYTQYLYNTLGQVVKQISPDTDSTEFWYDEIGRLILSRDGRQRAQNLVSYTFYDPLGRIVEVGEKSTAFSSTTISIIIESGYNSFFNWMNDPTTGARTHVTRTYYDEAPFDIATFDNGEQTNLRTRVATTTFEAAYDGVDSTYEYATHYSYDASGNVHTLVQEITDLKNYGHQFKRIDYDYDYISGNVNKVYYQKGKADQFTHRYEYDANNRLIDVYSSLVETDERGSLWEREASYIYYDHGPLARSIIGHRSVQGMDYAYTLQGWIKGVNSNGLIPEKDMGKDGSLTVGSNTLIARDAIGYTLSYFNGAYWPIGGNAFEMTVGVGSDLDAAQNLYNGNIRYMSIHNKGLGAPMAFSYSYDQLHRIKSMQSHDNASLTNFNWGSGGSSLYGMAASYDGNGNIQRLTRDGLFTGTTTSGQINNLVYDYEPGTNKLIGTTEYATGCRPILYIDDPITIDTALHASDQIKATSTLDGERVISMKADNCVELLSGFEIDATNTGYFMAENDSCPPPSPIVSTYKYDGKGNLIQTKEATSIQWSPYGKVVEVQLAQGNRKTLFGYDAAQNRAMKAQVKTDVADTTFTYYFRDASNNILSIYQRKSDTVQWKEQYLYGSSRLGSLRPNIQWHSVDTLKENPYFVGESTLKVGWKAYELTNHLGNVLATVSDRKQKVDTIGTQGQADYYEPVILSATDYYPFGLDMPGRTMSSGDYRMGFNGKEADRNKEWGGGVHYDYGFRIYNPTIGKFLSVDPLTASYPMLTPYQFASNKPIDGIDLDGLEYLNSTYAQVEIDAALTIPGLVGRGIEAVINTAETASSWVSPNYLYVDAVRRYARKQGLLIPSSFSNSDIADNYDIIFQLGKGFTVEPRGGILEEGVEVLTDALDMFTFSGASSGGVASVLSARIPYNSLAELIRQVPLQNFVKGINRTKGCKNCSDAALAVDRRLKGDLNAVAKSDLEVSTYGVNTLYKKLFGQPQVITTVGKFGDIVQGIKNGETGIVTISGTRQADGHAFNIINVDGAVKILDGQTEQIFSVDQIKGFLDKFDKSAGARFFNTTNKGQ